MSNSLYFIVLSLKNTVMYVESYERKWDSMDVFSLLLQFITKNPTMTNENFLIWEKVVLRCY